MRSLFDLLINLLSYNFRGYLKSTYPPISLEYWPIEVKKPSFLASYLFSTYILIASWYKSMLKTHLITFFKLLFLESYRMPWDLWRTLCPLLGYFMVFIILFTINMGNMKRGSPLSSHLQGWGRVTPFRRSFICPSPLSNIFKNHCTSPQQCLSIPNGQYPHPRPYEWDCPFLWPFFNLVGLKVKVLKCNLWSPLRISLGVKII